MAKTAPEPTRPNIIHGTRLSKILRVIAASASLQDAVPISACLIAPSDCGKSQLLLSHIPAGARVLDDLTTASLMQVLDDTPRPSLLLLPDFNMAIGHKSTVTRLLIACLLSLTGEGLTEIPGVDKSNPMKLKADELAQGGVRLSVLTALTPQMFFAHRDHWRALGFLRRMMPIYYSYNPDTIEKVQDKIRDTAPGTSLSSYPRLNLPQVRPGAPKIPDGIGIELEQLSRIVLMDQLVWRKTVHGKEIIIRAQEMPFTPHKTLRTYCRAHALLAGRKTCIDADLSATKDASAFLRYDRPEKI